MVRLILHPPLYIRCYRRVHLGPVTVLVEFPRERPCKYSRYRPLPAHLPSRRSQRMMRLVTQLSPPAPSSPRSSLTSDTSLHHSCLPPPTHYTHSPSPTPWTSPPTSPNPLSSPALNPPRSTPTVPTPHQSPRAPHHRSSRYSLFTSPHHGALIATPSTSSRRACRYGTTSARTHRGLADERS